MESYWIMLGSDCSVLATCHSWQREKINLTFTSEKWLPLATPPFHETTHKMVLRSIWWVAACHICHCLWACVYAWLSMTWKLWTWKCVLDSVCLPMSFITISVKGFGKQHVCLWHRWLCFRRLCVTPTLRDRALMFSTEAGVQALHVTWRWKSGNTSLSHNIHESSWNTKTVETITVVYPAGRINNQGHIMLFVPCNIVPFLFKECEFGLCTGVCFYAK